MSFGATHGASRRKHGRFALGLAFLASAIMPFFGIACGAVLGIEEPTDRQSIIGPADGPVGPTCTATEKVCSGLCVSKLDPKVGCEGTCSACASPPNAKSSCVTGACGFTDGDCHAGFDNCDGNLQNGCETQLTTKSACGSCKTNCMTLGLAYCTPTGGGNFMCTNTCMAPYVVASDGECVDPQKDTTHCGATTGTMGANCTVLNGSGGCVLGVCSITSCDAPYCDVANTCAVSNNQHCFPGCTPCATGTVCDNGGGGCVACTQTNATCGPNCDVDCGAGTCVGGACYQPLDSGTAVDAVASDATGACFVAGTPITLANGATKAIEEMEVGDEVLSYDTLTRTRVTGRVLQVFVHPHTRRFARLNGVVTTPEHRFYVSGTWVTAGALSIGDALSLADIASATADQETLATEATSELMMMSGDTTTYNFEVAVFHDYFAGGYLVHNTKTVNAPWP